MMKKPIYENENNVELYAVYATENNYGQKKCISCNRGCITVGEARKKGYTISSGISDNKWYCTHCNIVF